MDIPLARTAKTLVALMLWLDTVTIYKTFSLEGEDIQLQKI